MERWRHDILHGVRRLTKFAVEYRKAEDEDVTCHTCVYMEANGEEAATCELVRGNVYPDDVCSLWEAEEWLTDHGISPKLATAAQKAAGLADINFRFTNYISDMQRAIAYLDGAKHAQRKGYFNDPITGERVPMTEKEAEE